MSGAAPIESHTMLRSIINNSPPAERARLRAFANCRCCTNHKKIKSNPTEDHLLMDLHIDDCNCQCAEEILRYVRMKTWATPVVEVGINNFNLSLNGLAGNGVMRCEDIHMQEPFLLARGAPAGSLHRRNPEVGDLKLRLDELPDGDSIYSDPTETPRTRQKRMRRLLATSTRMARSFSHSLRGAFTRSFSRHNSRDVVVDV
jgi:hypothetical protein